jgi:hypothetical protein
MESSRRWWVRPLFGSLLGVLVVGLLVGFARGRASTEPIEPPQLPAERSALSPAQVELMAKPEAPPEPQLTATPTPAPRSRRAPEPTAKREHKPDRKREHKPAAKRTERPRSEPAPVTTPTRPACRRPVPKLGWLGNLRDRRIDESSGLAISSNHPDLAYTMNDEGTSPLIFGVQPSTGRTRSAFDLSGAGGFKDPEAIRTAPDGRIWLADTGDGHPDKSGPKHGDPDRSHVTIAVFDEPRPGYRGSVRARRHDITYSNGPHNVEALAIHPRTGQAWLISNADVGRVYRLPNPLRAGHNVAQATQHLMPGFVTDATFTTDGRFVLVRTMRTADVLVFNARTWTRVGAIKAPKLSKGESITVEPDGRTALLGSEGRHSPLVRVAIPSAGQRCPAA